MKEKRKPDFPQRKCTNTKCGALYGNMADYCGRCGTQFPPPQTPVDEEEKRSHRAVICNNGANHYVLAKPFGVEYCIVCGEKISSATRH